MFFIIVQYGRKHALVLSLFLMAVPTFMLGCLPTYQQVGSLSTVLLVICRLLQGISTGGQLPAALIYAVEMRPKEHWGFYGSLGKQGAFFLAASWSSRRYQLTLIASLQ